MILLETNEFCEKVLKAYRKSAAYRAIHEGKSVRGTVGAALPREPGEDREELALGIARDPLEAEFMDKKP